MKITLVDGTPHQLVVTTVTLMRDPIDPTRLNVMHCYKCGTKVTQHQGNLIRIMPGGLPINIMEATPHVVAYCSNCKTKYLINII